MRGRWRRRCAVGEYCRRGSGDLAEDWHHRIHPKQRPPEINRVLVDWHSMPQIGSLDSENQNSTGPEATGDQHNPGADLCDCHALQLHLALVHERMVAMVRARFYWCYCFFSNRDVKWTLARGIANNFLLLWRLWVCEQRAFTWPMRRNRPSSRPLSWNKRGNRYVSSRRDRDGTTCGHQARHRRSGCVSGMTSLAQRLGENRARIGEPGQRPLLNRSQRN
jgi:hypothetical protein